MRYKGVKSKANGLDFSNLSREELLRDNPSLYRSSMAAGNIITHQFFKDWGNEFVQEKWVVMVTCDGEQSRRIVNRISETLSVHETGLRTLDCADPSDYQEGQFLFDIRGKNDDDTKNYMNIATRAIEVENLSYTFHMFLSVVLPQTEGLFDMIEEMRDN